MRRRRRKKIERSKKEEENITFILANLRIVRCSAFFERRNEKTEKLPVTKIFKQYEVISILFICIISHD